MKVHDARDGFNDLKPQYILGRDIPWLWVLVGIIVVLLFLKFYKKKPKEIVKEKKLISQYLAELKALEAKVLAAKETPKAIAAEASLLVRRFIYDRTGVSILECTPQEAENQLTKSVQFSKITSVDIAKLLQQLENISFAELKNEDSIQSKVINLLGQSEDLLKKIESKSTEGPL